MTPAAAPAAVLVLAAMSVALLADEAAAATEGAVDERCSAATGDAVVPGDSNCTSVSGEAGNVDAEEAPDGVVLPTSPPEVGALQLGVIFFIFSMMIGWIGIILKFACDGSLPARLALWGFLPEAYAAISVSAVNALLRLKKGPTPVVVLQNCVTDVGAKELAEAFQNYGKKAELVAIELPHNPQLSARGLDPIVEVALHKDSTISELDVSYNPQFGNTVVAVLRPLLEAKSSKLQVLRVADCGISAAGAVELADAATKSKLRTLDLSYNPLSGATDALTAVIEAPPVLEELILSGCALEIEDVKAVAEQLPFTSLRSIQLGGNNLGSAGVAALAEHLPTSMIDEIGLEANDIEAGCEGLNALGVAWVRRPFSRVRLNGNRMSNAEIASFVKLLKSMRA